MLFGFKAIRAVTLEGELWFPVVDVGRAVGHALTGVAQKVRATVDVDEARLLRRRDCLSEIRVDMFENTSAPSLLLVSESGLYKFILRAHPSNPTAKAFQDWVTKVVLPAIRKDGGYVKDEEKVATGELGAGASEQVPFNLEGSGDAPTAMQTKQIDEGSGGEAF